MGPSQPFPSWIPHFLSRPFLEMDCIQCWQSLVQFGSLTYSGELKFELLVQGRGIVKLELEPVGSSSSRFGSGSQGSELRTEFFLSTGNAKN